MDDDNPFDLLGLKKEVVELLYQKGRLDEYLKRYFHFSQTFLHPDIGGSNDLSARVNGAYAKITRHPEQVANWIHGMQNGHSQYREMLEQLIPELERLKTVERDYEGLRVKYANLLAGNKVDGTVREARAAASSSRTSSGRASAVPPKVEYEEPIELSDLFLYDLKGKPFKKYSKIVLDGAAPRSDSGYITKNPDEWIAYAKSKGKEALSFPLALAAIEKMKQDKHPGLPGFVKEICDSWFSFNTRIDYSKNKVIHGYGFPSSYEGDFNLPVRNVWLDEVVDDKKWRTALCSLFMSKDLGQSINLLQEIWGVRSYIWSPSTEDRKNIPMRAVFADANVGRLVLDCDSSLYWGCSRSVELK